MINGWEGAFFCTLYLVDTNHVRCNNIDAIAYIHQESCVTPHGDNQHLLGFGDVHKLQIKCSNMQKVHKRLERGLLAAENWSGIWQIQVWKAWLSRRYLWWGLADNHV